MSQDREVTTPLNISTFESELNDAVGLKTPLRQAPWYTQMSTAFMPVLRRGAMGIRASTMDGASTPAMKMATAFVKCMSTRWRAFGHSCVVGYVRIGASPKRNCRSTSVSSSSFITCAGEAKHCWARSLSCSFQKTPDPNKSVRRRL